MSYPNAPARRRAPGMRSKGRFVLAWALPLQRCRNCLCFVEDRVHRVPPFDVLIHTCENGGEFVSRKPHQERYAASVSQVVSDMIRVSFAQSACDRMKKPLLPARRPFAGARPGR